MPFANPGVGEIVWLNGMPIIIYSDQINRSRQIQQKTIIPSHREE